MPGDVLLLPDFRLAKVGHKPAGVSPFQGGSVGRSWSPSSRPAGVHPPSLYSSPSVGGVGRGVGSRKAMLFVRRGGGWRREVSLPPDKPPASNSPLGIRQARGAPPLKAGEEGGGEARSPQTPAQGWGVRGGVAPIPPPVRYSGRGPLLGGHGGKGARGECLCRRHGCCPLGG